MHCTPEHFHMLVYGLSSFNEATVDLTTTSFCEGQCLVVKVARQQKVTGKGQVKAFTVCDVSGGTTPL